MSNSEALKNLTAARQANLTEQHDLRCRLDEAAKQLAHIEGGITVLMQLEQVNQSAAPDDSAPQPSTRNQ